MPHGTPEQIKEQRKRYKQKRKAEGTWNNGNREGQKKRWKKKKSKRMTFEQKTSNSCQRLSNYIVIGIDGEGFTTDKIVGYREEELTTGKWSKPNKKHASRFVKDKAKVPIYEHRYVYLAAVWEEPPRNAWAKLDTRVIGPYQLFEREITNLEGLSSAEIFEFIVSLPSSSEYKKFGFSLGYDYTMWFKDLPPDIIYDLNHPDTRRTAHGLPGARIQHPWKLNLLRGQFQLQKLSTNHKKECGRIHNPELGLKKGQTLLRFHNPHSHRVECMKQDCPGCRYYCTIHHYRSERCCLFSSLKECEGCEPLSDQHTVWDVWQFYQSSFVKAIEDWNKDTELGDNLVIAKDELERMKEMKKARPDFDPSKYASGEIQRYCKNECLAMSRLGRLLNTGHAKAKIPLAKWYGAGSSGEALMDQMGAMKFMKRNPDDKKEKFDYRSPELLRAILCAFFGGRFEMNRVGLIERPVYNNDISSAYPYEFCFLPCLHPDHGEWEHVTDRRVIDRKIDDAKIALIHYRLPQSDLIPVDYKRMYYVDESAEQICYMLEVSNEYRVKKGEGDGYASTIPWGPFPYRHSKTGNIFFPVVSGGGWVWKKEFQAGRDLQPNNLEVLEAYIYHQKCDCMVFRESMPNYYRLRTQWGKDGKGKVLKLACNSCPGKTAQRIGAAPYRNWVWAGLVNSGTRSELLKAINRAGPEHILMCATDGALSDVKIDHPKPVDTGTYDLKKPLGGWEVEEYPNGFLLVRPGVYMNIVDKERDDKIRTRGTNRSSALKKRDQIIEDFRKNGLNSICTTSRQLFNGMKVSVNRNEEGLTKKHAKYGTWQEQQFFLNYACQPKRPVIFDSIVRKNEYALGSWAFTDGKESAPYGMTRLPLHVILERLMKEIESEQPDREDTFEDVEEG